MENKKVCFHLDPFCTFILLSNHLPFAVISKGIELESCDGTFSNRRERAFDSKTDVKIIFINEGKFQKVSLKFLTLYVNDFSL